MYLQWNFPSPDALGGVYKVDDGRHYLRLSISVSAWAQTSMEWWKVCKGWWQETSHVSECGWPPDGRDKTELRNDCLLLTTRQLSILGDKMAGSFRVLACCLPRLLSAWIIHISLAFVVMGIRNSGIGVTLHSVILSLWNKRVTQWMHKMVTLSVVTKYCGLFIVFDKLLCDQKECHHKFRSNALLASCHCHGDSTRSQKVFSSLIFLEWQAPSTGPPLAEMFAVHGSKWKIWGLVPHEHLF